MNAGAREPSSISSLVLAVAGDMGVCPDSPRTKPTPEERAADLAAQEAWLQRNAAVSCPHLSARITAEQCAALRARPENGAATTRGTTEARPPQCSTCTAYPGFDPEKHAEEEARRKQEFKTGMGTCEACARKQVNRVQEGLCNSCNLRHKTGRLNQVEGQWVFANPHMVTRGADPENTLVLVDGRVRTLADLTEEEIEAARTKRQAQAKKEEKSMGKTGECVACHRNMTLNSGDKCSTCNNRVRDGKLHEVNGQWVFKSPDDVPDGAIRPFAEMGACRVLVSTPGGPMPADQLGEVAAENAMAREALAMSAKKAKDAPLQDPAGQYETGLEPDPFPGFDSLLGDQGHDGPAGGSEDAPQGDRAVRLAMGLQVDHAGGCGTCGGTGVAAEDGDTCPECGAARAKAAAQEVEQPTAERRDVSDPGTADPFASLDLTRFDGVFPKPMKSPAMGVTTAGEFTLNGAVVEGIVKDGPRAEILAQVLDDGTLAVGIRGTKRTGLGTYALGRSGGRLGVGRKIACKAFCTLYRVKHRQRQEMTWSPKHGAWCAVVEREAA